MLERRAAAPPSWSGKAKPAALSPLAVSLSLCRLSPRGSTVSPLPCATTTWSVAAYPLSPRSGNASTICGGSTPGGGGLVDLSPRPRVPGANPRVARVDDHGLAALEILEGGETDIGQLTIAGVREDHGHHVVFGRGQGERPLVARVVEVTDDERDAAASRRTHERLERRAQVGGGTEHGLAITGCVRIGQGMRGGETEDLAHHAHHVLLALLGRHDALDLVGRHDQPDPVVVPDGAEGQECGDLACDPHLGGPTGTEALAGRQIDHEHHGHLALFDEDLHEGLAHPGADVPVDR